MLLACQSQTSLVHHEITHLICPLSYCTIPQFFNVKKLIKKHLFLPSLSSRDGDLKKLRGWAQGPLESIHESSALM